MKTPKLDLLQLHNLDGIGALIAKLQAWNRAGRIRYFGAMTLGTSQHAVLIDAKREYRLDFFQVDYSLGNRDAGARVLAEVLERRVAVLANLALAPAKHISNLKAIMCFTECCLARGRRMSALDHNF